MSLLSDLHLLGVQFCVDVVEVSFPSFAGSGVIRPVPRLRVRLADMSAAEAMKTEPVTHEFFFPVGTAEKGVEKLVAVAMKKHMPQHPAMLNWFQSRGNDFVKIEPYNLQEGMGQAIHVALRKSCEGPLSCIQWRAIGLLALEDWSNFIEGVRCGIIDLQKSVASGKKIALKRLDVARVIQQVFCDADCLVEDAFTIQQKRIPPCKKRTPEQDFAFLALTSACKATDLQEFVHGWTAYLCESFTEEEEQKVRRSFDKKKAKEKAKAKARSSKPLEEPPKKPKRLKKA